MNKEKTAQIIPALLTPCSSPGVVDAASVRSLCRHLYANGATGVFAASSTGGLPLMAGRQRQAVIEAAREETASNRCLFAGASGTGVEHILGNIRDAASAGADVAVLMAPFFFRLSQQQLIDYFQEIADSSALPLAFYHHKNMPTAFAVESVQKLSGHPNIVGFKENSGDTERAKLLGRTVESKDFTVYQGSEPLLLESLKNGTRACVTALGNVAPALHAEIYHRWDAGDIAGAEQAQDKLSTLWRIFRQPAVEQSIGHFTQSLLIPLHEAGIIKNTATLLPKFKEDPGFRQEVIDFYSRADWK